MIKYLPISQFKWLSCDDINKFDVNSSHKDKEQRHIFI